MALTSAHAAQVGADTVATISRYGDVLAIGDGEFDGSLKAFGLNVTGDARVTGGLQVDGSLSVDFLSTESLGLNG